MTIQMDFDLSDSYNRIVDIWYPVFTPNGQLSMPVAACAYPINMGEHTIAAIRDEVQPEDYHLRWQMAIAGDGHAAPSEYHLYCNWQGRAWVGDDQRLLFVDNAVGWVDWVGPDGGARLEVQVAFGHPSFEGQVATMAVDFLVTETATNGGSTIREVRRPFQIYADGRRDRLV